MTLNGWLEIVATVCLTVLFGWTLGGYIAKVWEQEPTPLDRVLEPVEEVIYRLAGIDRDQDQTWLQFAFSFLAYSAMGVLALYALLRLQGHLPLNPEGVGGMAAPLAFNTAVSFATNTGWEAFSGDHALSHLSQMVGLSVQAFASGAAGLAIAAALARSFSVSRRNGIGNFWINVVRAHLYILLPGAIVLALALAALGVPETLLNHVNVTTIEGAHQSVLVGPVASQKAIALLGTDSGGFFSANSAHPFEDPSPLSNLIETIAMGALAFGCVTAFGRVIYASSDARALTAVMAVMLLAAASGIYVAEAGPTPALMAAHSSGPNMEGKEVRFGAPASSVFAAMTTGTSAGASNADLESFTPAGGGIAMFLMMIGEILPGGAGSGLYGIITIALLAMFVSGQMVGRTPEYLGKKIETREIKLAVLAVLILGACILGFSALASVSSHALARLSTRGPHGLSEILYAYASSSANNGSSFSGLKADTPFWTITTAAAMMLGRFGYVIPIIAIAGSLAAKPKLPPSSGTFPTDGPLFVVLLSGVILIIAGLQYFPAMALGPAVEQLQMNQQIQALAAK
jgi:K+-transporting ATPase ATPase A chain